MYQGRNQSQVENNYIIGLAGCAGLFISLLLFFIVEILIPFLLTPIP